MTLAEYKMVSGMVEETKVLKEDLRRIQQLEERMERNKKEPVTLDIKSSASVTLAAFSLNLSEGETRCSLIWSYSIGQKILSTVKEELEARVSAIEQEMARFTGTEVDHLESNKDKEGQTDGCN